MRRYFDSNQYSRDYEPQSKRHKPEEPYKKRYENENNSQTSNSECDKKLDELITYFKTVLQTLKTIPKDDSDMFVSNALEESKGYEVKLSSNRISSHCIELLLSICKNPEIWIQFMKAFSTEKIEVCTSANASHIAELLLNIAIKNIENWESILETEEDSEQKSHVLYYMSWVSEFGEFVQENLESCLQDQYASHVACIIVRALGGDTSKASSVMSKKNVDHKKNFNNQYGEEKSDGSHQEFSVTLEKAPKMFIKIIKSIYKTLVEVEAISDYALESSSAIFIETLLSVLTKRSPKSSRKLVLKLSEKIFSEKNEAGIPLAFLHKNISYVVESIFQAADEEMKINLWNEYCSDCLESLIDHNIGNFILQRLFDVVESQTLFATMSEKIGSLFKTILKSRHYGIFLSIAGACNRLKIQQAQFMKNIMQCLDCAEPEDRQARLIPQLVGLTVYTQGSGCICLQGSLLAQTILKFQKPIKAVNSLLSMKPQELSHLACHIQGCHVLNAFFSSENVGEKSKDKLIHNLKPCLTNLACDRNGGMTLSRVWVLLTLKQRSTVAQQLVQDEKTIDADRNGNVLLKKFGIFHFKKNRDKWKEIQNNLTASKRKNVKMEVI